MDDRHTRIVDTANSEDGEPLASPSTAIRPDVQFGRRLLLPLAALLIVAVLAVSGLLIYAVERQNDQAMVNARHLARSLVKALSDDMARITKDHAWWTEGYQKLIVSPDPDWADDNVGPYVHDAFGFSFSFVLSAENKILYSAVDGVRRPAGPFDILGPGLKNLIELARRKSMEVPEAVTGFIRALDGIHLVGVSAISPEGLEGTSPPWSPRPVLVYSRRIDPALLAMLAKDYLLQDLRTDFSRHETSDAALALRAADGAIVGSLIWTPSNPGSGFVRLVATPLVFLVLIAIFASVLIVRRALSVTSAMATQAEALALTNHELIEQQEIASQARAKAEIANEAKSRFLANVSHELRSPLDAIIGYSDLVRRQLERVSGDRVLIEQSEAINQSGHHLLDLIDDLIDISRIEVGVLPLDERTLDPRDVVQFCRRLLAPRANDAKITFDMSVADGVPLLRADERRLRQILINLLTNAIKYTPGGGMVALCCRMEKDSIAFAISDNGPGIHWRDLDRLLQPFQRGDKVVAEEKREGAGLGLALAKGLIEEHGGTLTVDSAPGKGTTMAVVFPAERSIARPR